MSLVARALEQAGIATVIIGSAKDIVEYCGVPRFLFVDFPLGNPCGRPEDRDSQQAIMDSALGLLESATSPTTSQMPLVWGDDAGWKENYMRVGPDNIEALRAAGKARMEEQAALKARDQASAG